MRKRSASWECGRRFETTGNLFPRDPELYRLRGTPRIRDGNVKRSCQLTMTPERKARALQNAKLAQMARRFAERCARKVSDGRFSH